VFGRWESRDQPGIKIGPFCSVRTFGVVGAMLGQMAALLARERPSNVGIGRVDVPNEQQNPTCLSVSNTGSKVSLAQQSFFISGGGRCLMITGRSWGHQAHPDPHWLDCRRVSMSAHCSPCHRQASGMRCVECSSTRRQTCSSCVMVRHVSLKAWFIKGLSLARQQGLASCSS
jgi:hypothetical protein